MRQRRARLSRAGGGLLLLLAVGLLFAACIPSSPMYPVDFYHEMHYTQVQSLGEPPRLDPPDGAVPVTGMAPEPAANEAAQLQNPLQPTPEVLERGKQVFTQNCQACHGQAANGQSTLAGYFQAAVNRRPADLTAATTANRSDGELYTIIRQGSGPLQRGAGVMPPFGNLISGDDTWAVIAYVRSLQQPARQ